MSVAVYARSVTRAPGQDNFRNGQGARFGMYSGFTLIELLVVIAIIAILASILFPVFASAKQNAQQTRCISNLKQITTAWLTYADDNNGRACPAFYYSDDFCTLYSWDFTTDLAADPTTYKLGLIGPYTKSGAINGCPSFVRSVGNAWGRPYTGYAYNTSYVGASPHNNPPLPNVPAVVSRIAQPSRTVAFADGGYGAGPVRAQNYLRAPSDPNISGGTVHFRHGGRANVSYADGHVTAVGIKFIYDPHAPECGMLSQDDSAYDLR